jgi:anti-sigma-K factor RskA
VTEEDDILAAEFALGLLDEAEAAAAQARARTDSVLSLRIAWWRDQLAPLAGEAATAAPIGVWQRIEAQLPGNDNADTARPWKWATGGMGLVAAGLLAVIAFQPTPTPIVIPPNAPPMMAALSGEKGAVVAVSYDAGSGKMVVAPTVLDAGKGDAELWIIPEGGKPRSLGVVNTKLARTHVVPENERTFVQPGATFAITQEAKGGSPDGDPHGPIVASGKIIRT